MFAKGYQSRKFLLTINNPESAGMTHEEIIDRAQKFNPDYFCMADEIGASGTYHTHVYLYSESPMRFETVKKRFPTAHIDKAAGPSWSNRDYIRKEGKWPIPTRPTPVWKGLSRSSVRSRMSLRRRLPEWPS